MTPSVNQIPVPTLPQAPAPPPVFGSDPTTQKPSRKTPTASYLNSSALPSPSQVGQKKLVGQ